MTDRTAATSDDLWTALKASTAGDRILVAAGTYTDFTAQNMSPGGVTILPADPAHPPVFAGFALTGCVGVNVSGLEVTPSARTHYGIYVGNSSDVHFDKMQIHSADGTLTDNGFFFRESKNVSLTNSEVHHLGGGGGHLDCDGVAVTGNAFHDFESDAVHGASDNVIISRNSFTDFFILPGDHPDAIQFWGKSDGSKGTNILVEGNVITRGKSFPMSPQGIFFENSANVTVRGNAMIGTLYNGIAFSNVATGLIEGNLVMGYPDMGTDIIYRGGSSDITIRDNTVTQPVTTYAGAGEAGCLRVTESGTKTIPVPAQGSLVEFNAWVAANIPEVAPTPPVPTPTPSPPVPAPPVTPPVVVDPRDEQIKTLAAQVATLTQSATDNAALLAAANAKAATLTDKLTAATVAALAQASQIAALTTRATTAEKALATSTAKITSAKKALS